mmetsp:Transcript_514/g.1322  ORF Transcript_514/g.1322 Transcript_514/m.1322 type:complete len:213 (+) Transcript_514:1522-2160(+)
MGMVFAAGEVRHSRTGSCKPTSEDNSCDSHRRGVEGCAVLRCALRSFFAILRRSGVRPNQLLSLLQGACEDRRRGPQAQPDVGQGVVKVGSAMASWRLGPPPPWLVCGARPRALPGGLRNRNKAANLLRPERFRWAHWSKRAHRVYRLATSAQRRLDSMGVDGRRVVVSCERGHAIRRHARGWREPGRAAPTQTGAAPHKKTYTVLGGLTRA